MVGRMEEVVVEGDGFFLFGPTFGQAKGFFQRRARTTEHLLILQNCHCMVGNSTIGQRWVF